MFRETVSVIILSMLLIGTLAMVFDVKLVNAGGGVIHIRADGSIDPPTANITLSGNVAYTFVGDINDQVMIERSSITIDGKGYTLQGYGSGNGFYCSSIDNVTIKNTNIRNFEVGIMLNYSSKDSVIGNQMTNNSHFGMWLVFSSSNTISGNNITDNQNGIWFDFSSNNSLSGNNIRNNYYGAGLESFSNGNSIYHNNFIGNIQHVCNDASTNLWDNGYPYGGNYWSSYNGSDLFHGPHQNETGSDGIGDQPFTIDQNNVDHYPLTNLWPPRVAVTNFTTSKVVIGQGCTSSVNVTFENLGNEVEAFNATIYANSTRIHSEHITLTMTNRTFSLSSIWNTTGFAYGNYTLTASAELDAGDNATTNNCTSSVIVTIPGDINGNFNVNLIDLVILANSYGSVSGDGRWNANADINDNGIVGLSDLGYLAQHYAQHYP